MNKHLIIGLLASSLIAFGCGDDDPVGTDGGTDSGTDGGTGGDFTFRSDAVTAYTQVDRIGMPAVATAVIGSAMKDAYNQDTPAGDVAMVGTPPALTYAAEITAQLEGLHLALADDFATLSFGTCATVSGDPATADVSDCIGQATGAIEVLVDAAADPQVTAPVSVIPDVLTINATAAAGFPNGRLLEDTVMDVTLAVLLLDLSAGNTACDGSACTVGTLVGTNPTTNDATFNTTFPFVAAPNTL